MANEANTVNEEIYTTEKLARAKRLHPSTIRKLFLDEPGVLRLGRGRRRGQRQYYTLRIPRGGESSRQTAQRPAIRHGVTEPLERSRSHSLMCIRACLIASRASGGLSSIENSTASASRKLCVQKGHVPVLKKEATRPAGANLLQRQAKFDAFLEEFNNERPHEALDMKCPGELYSASCRPYQGLAEPHYPFHDKTVVVTNCGRLCLYRKKINLSTCLAGQAAGIKEVDDGIWLVSFMDYDLGYIDLEEKTLQPLNNPFGPKVLPMS